MPTHEPSAIASPISAGRADAMRPNRRVHDAILQLLDISRVGLGHGLVRLVAEHVDGDRAGMRVRGGDHACWPPERPSRVSMRSRTRRAVSRPMKITSLATHSSGVCPVGKKQGGTQQRIVNARAVAPDVRIAEEELRICRA